MRLIALVLLVLLLSACGPGGSPTRVEYRTVSVPIVAACPDPATKAKLDAAKPVPLRQQAKPATADLARAAEREQLRRYEAPDQWADQAQAVIDDCASRPPLPAPAARDPSGHS